MRKVYVAGAGVTRVSDHWNMSLLDLSVEAGLKALSGLKPDMIVVGNMFSAASSRQEHLGALVADALNMEGLSAFKVEAACASGGVALHVGYGLVRSGVASSILILGVEKMRDLEPAQISSALSMAESAEYTQFFGVSFVALNAMLTKLYMHEYGVTREELSAFPVIAHRNALTVEHAQFRREISIEDVSKSMPVADPLRLLDCAPVGDGAAALMLIGEEKVSEVKGRVAEVLGSAVATSRFNVYERDNMLDFTATRRAVGKAFSSAGVSLSDVDFIEVHDAFSITAALSLEAMDVSRRAEAARDASNGRFDLKGKLPISTFGGLKGRGNPVGAAGVYQAAEAFLQLTGGAGVNQVEEAKIGLIHNMGGIDTTAAVHILRRVEG